MKYTRVCLLLILMFMMSAQIVYAANLDPLANGSHYVWGENIGWIDLAPSDGSGVTISDALVTGMAWSENTGWIDLNPAGGGVTNDGTGKLSGMAWSENGGWIDFNPAGGGVYINACGEFNGSAWGENVGWISFRSDTINPFKVVSTWVSAIDTVPPVTSFFPPIKPWYAANMQFDFIATDCGSGVKEIHSTINSGTETVTPGAAFQAAISQEGCSNLNYFAVDNAGNPETARQLSVCIDKTPPVITLTVPPDNASYYINSQVTPVYTINDGISGVSLSSVDTMFTKAAGSSTFTVAATDNAGNAAAVTHAYTVIYPGNIDPASTECQYAWGENIGWINFQPDWGPGVTTTGTALTGMAWSENFGWIDLAPANGGVINDGKGNLSGYAWMENIGWINFNPDDGGVFIGMDGSFSGNAWGENSGWIVFNAPNTCLTSTWQNPYPPAAPFSFASQTTFALNTDITSNTITVSGITTSWPIKISGGQYSINGAPFTPIAGIVNNGDQVAVKVASAAAYGATTSARLAIGGVSATFSVTTVQPPCNWKANVSGIWSDTTKWSCGHAPGAGDDAYITAAGTYTVTLDSSPSIHSFNLSGPTLSGSGQTLTISADANITGASTLSGAALNLNGKTLSLSAQLILTGGATLNGGTISSGTTAGLWLNYTGGLNSATLDGVTLNAPMTIDPRTTLNISNGLTLNNTLTMNAANYSTYYYLFQSILSS